MKRFIQSVAAVAMAGLVLVGCQSDNVVPQENKNGNPNLAGALGDPHPMLDTLCQSSDTLWLWREDNGSPVVDKCFGYGGVPVACSPTQQLKWGGLVMNEGYLNNENFIDCNFWMAPGWFCNFNNWEFGVTNSFTFDQNGIPVVTNDWSNLIVNPVANKWQLRLAVADLPTGEFDLALRVGAVKLNLFGATIPGSATTLWGRNAKWDNTASNSASNSQWVMHFAPARCLEVQTPVLASCETFYAGVVSCTNISADIAGLSGALTYQWSNGATSPSINVCPTATTTYSVTIKDATGTAVRINEVTVNYVDAACGNGNNTKVWVCHIPPGNPENPQEICISTSALPAHIERFRVAGTNPNQGHDSGCEIGRCNSNTCL